MEEQAIERRYFHTPESYRTQFKSDYKQSGETFEDYACRLELHFQKWLEVKKEISEIPEVSRCFNLVLMDQFLSTIRSDNLRIKLQERKLKTISELARAAQCYNNVTNQPNPKNNPAFTNSAPQPPSTCMFTNITPVSGNKPSDMPPKPTPPSTAPNPFASEAVYTRNFFSDRMSDSV